MPAIDVIHVDGNEGSRNIVSSDISLAFVGTFHFVDV